MPAPTIQPVPTIQRSLLRWYDRNRRDLPWRRRSNSAYHQWLAEMMLQQTQVETVVPYYRRFIQRFPDVQRLSDASRDEVLRMWAGLGYYSRARNLHKTAQIIVRDYDGIFPQDVEQLKALPGIGRYTAGAIASIAFGRREAILDGNVRRVLTRLFPVIAVDSASQRQHALWDLAEKIVPRKRCGDFNQALMELGATVCKPREPQCPRCPLKRWCNARAADPGAVVCPPTSRPAVRSIDMVVAVIVKRGRYLIRRRADRGLWGGMWEFPSLELPADRSAERGVTELVSEITGDSSGRAQPIGRIAHRLTHRIVRMQVYRCRVLQATRARRSSTSRWVCSREFERFAFARAQRKVMDLALRPGAGNPQPEPASTVLK